VAHPLLHVLRGQARSRFTGTCAVGTNPASEPLKASAQRRPADSGISALRQRAVIPTNRSDRAEPINRGACLTADVHQTVQVTNSDEGRRRESFDEVADLYDRARPGYPDPLLADLWALAGLSSDSRVLEIGPGTGQLTVPLARTGCRIVAVELGAELAAVARRNLAGFDRVQVVAADFEDWPLPDEPFDLVVSATAFHWLHPQVRLVKSARALRPGGALAVIATHHVAGGTPGYDELAQTCYARWVGADPGFRPPAADSVERDDELDRSPLFGSPVTRRYLRDLPYTSRTYADLVGTYSNNLALSAETRAGLLACLTDLIDSRFGGHILKTVLTEMQVAAAVPTTSEPTR
jgi:SAM-dependent methyltransferase